MPRGAHRAQCSALAAEVAGNVVRNFRQKATILDVWLEANPGLADTADLPHFTISWYTVKP